MAAHIEEANLSTRGAQLCSHPPPGGSFPGGGFPGCGFANRLPRRLFYWPFACRSLFRHRFLCCRFAGWLLGGSLPSRRLANRFLGGGLFRWTLARRRLRRRGRWLMHRRGDWRWLRRGRTGVTLMRNRRRLRTPLRPRWTRRLRLGRLLVRRLWRGDFLVFVVSDLLRLHGPLRFPTKKFDCHTVESIGRLDRRQMRGFERHKLGARN